MLHENVARLGFAVREAVAKRRSANGVSTTRRVRIKRRDFNLKYHEDFGFANFAPQRTEVDSWNSQDQDIFQQSVIRNMPEYESVASALGAHSQLDAFVRRLCYESFRGLDDEELRQIVTAFLRELSEEPLPVTVTAFLDGFEISESPLAISSNVLLRRPTEDDVSEYVQLDEYGTPTSYLPETWFRVVGEFTFVTVSPSLARRDFLRTIDALRLFRVGGVAANRYSIRSRHSFPGSTAGGTGRYSRFKYSLSNLDARPLEAFLAEVVPTLPDSLHPEQTTSRPVTIAHSRYVDALFQGSAEQTITAAITALEALFLTNEPELTHRLAQRVSVFLRFIGTQTNGVDTYNNVAAGYKIRSTFIHGGALKTKDRPHADTLVGVLAEYARQCVLATYQIEAPKRELLKTLDHSLIDPHSCDDLVRCLSSVVHK